MKKREEKKQRGNEKKIREVDERKGRREVRKKKITRK